MSQEAGRLARRCSRNLTDDKRPGLRSIRSLDALSDDAAANGAFSPFRSVAASHYGERKPGGSPHLASPHGERRASFRLAQELKRRIETGVYAYGDWLPIEQALLFDFPVSRTVLREAIIILECQGLIISHHGLGNRIVAAQRLEDKAVLKSIDPLALLEACLFFETEAAALAAGLSGEKSLQVPSRSFSSSLLTACHRFHVGLAEASENRVVSASIKNLWDFALNHGPRRGA